MSADQLAFGPATVTLFGAVIPVLPTLCAAMSVYLARLIAPPDRRHFTKRQKRALTTLLMMVAAGVCIRFPTKIREAEAIIVGLSLGWVGLAFPEAVGKAVWEGFKNMLRKWLEVSPPPLPNREKKTLIGDVLREAYHDPEKMAHTVEDLHAEDLLKALDQVPGVTPEPPADPPALPPPEQPPAP